MPTPSDIETLTSCVGYALTTRQLQDYPTLLNAFQAAPGHPPLAIVELDLRAVPLDLLDKFEPIWARLERSERALLMTTVIATFHRERRNVFAHWHHTSQDLDAYASALFAHPHAEVNLETLAWLMSLEGFPPTTLADHLGVHVPSTGIDLGELNYSTLMSRERQQAMLKATLQKATPAALNYLLSRLEVPLDVQIQVAQEILMAEQVEKLTVLTAAWPAEGWHDLGEALLLAYLGEGSTTKTPNGQSVAANASIIDRLVTAHPALIPQGWLSHLVEETDPVIWEPARQARAQARLTTLEAPALATPGRRRHRS